eukprot:CAMPEP_0169450038 /NCGR_PEP_ID=MMETSP1042-20121227/12941_1 /TAXON_ID=464988 /ORGANISM="Hemiselmis andersenii, Strain CCMP1180" /LENGTH=94 /DNA_ID=CAMNT_0009561837 /DNA_START=397 /DNA_END=677 /DNA_ORIENTATION=+
MTGNPRLRRHSTLLPHHVDRGAWELQTLRLGSDNWRWRGRATRGWRVQGEASTPYGMNRCNRSPRENPNPSPRLVGMMELSVALQQQQQQTRFA